MRAADVRTRRRKEEEDVGGGGAPQVVLYITKTVFRRIHHSSYGKASKKNWEKAVRLTALGGG